MPGDLKDARDDSPECVHKAWMDYVARRMATAVERMGDCSLTSHEWESALRWATVWGMAMRLGPRCRRTDTSTVEAGTMSRTLPER